MFGGKESRHNISVRPLDNLVESQHYDTTLGSDSPGE